MKKTESVGLGLKVLLLITTFMYISEPINTAWINQHVDAYDIGYIMDNGYRLKGVLLIVIFALIAINAIISLVKSISINRVIDLIVSSVFIFFLVKDFRMTNVIIGYNYSQNYFSLGYMPFHSGLNNWVHWIIVAFALLSFELISRKLTTIK